MLGPHYFISPRGLQYVRNGPGDLEVKFWGSESLTKICKSIGKFSNCDRITQQRTFLQYARGLIEVDIGRQFPNVVKFIDEKGRFHTVFVSYDWLPVSCDGCKGMGHLKKDCRHEKREMPKL